MSALANKAGATGDGGDAAEQYAQQSAELQGADPQMLVRQLNQMQKLLGVIFVQTIQRLPNVGGQVSKVMSQMTRAIKEAQQAASTAAAVHRPSVDFSAASPSAGPEAAGAAARTGPMNAANASPI